MNNLEIIERSEIVLMLFKIYQTNGTTNNPFIDNCFRNISQKEYDDSALERMVNHIEYTYFNDPHYADLSSLYSEIMEVYKKHIDLMEDIEYVILTSWTLLTWRIPQLREVPYLLFLGDRGSGKTHAMTVVSHLCSNPIFGSTITASAVFRLYDQRNFVLFLDEFEQYIGSDKKQMVAILNAGYKKGGKAIVNIPNATEGWIPKEYEVFGPKALASTVMPEGAFASRLIVIPMIRNTRPILYRLSESELKDLVRKLDHYQEITKDSELADNFDYFTSLGVNDSRLKELFNSLYSVTSDEYKQKLVAYLVELDKEKDEEEGVSMFSDLYHAIVEALKISGKSGVIMIRDVASIYNSEKEEDEVLSHKQVGLHLKTMGLTKVRRLPKGNARVVTERILSRLEKRYNRGQQILD